MNKEKALSLAAASGLAARLCHITAVKKNMAVGKSRKNWSTGKYLKKNSTGL